MPKNLEIPQNFIIFAPNLYTKNMAGRFLILGAGLKAKTGEWDEYNYTRRLPGRPENIVSICEKPKYTKTQKKKMAKRPQVQRFCQVNAEASAIWHNPELKAEWAARHAAHKREGSKHNKYVYVRLWDYIRHELNKAKTESEKGIQN